MCHATLSDNFTWGFFICEVRVLNMLIVCATSTYLRSYSVNAVSVYWIFIFLELLNGQG